MFNQTSDTTQRSCTTWVNRPPRQITNVTAWRVRNVRPYDHIVSDEHFLCDVLIVANGAIFLWQPIVWICRTKASYTAIYGLDRFNKQTAAQLHDAIIAAVQSFQYGSKERAS